MTYHRAVKPKSFVGMFAKDLAAVIGLMVAVSFVGPVGSAVWGLCKGLFQ